MWLVYHKAHTGIAAIYYDDSVCEALCFGWVDSLIRRLDDDRYARKFTPRKASSNWSDSNRKRWKQMEAAGLLADAGRRAAPTANRSVKPDIPQRTPAYITAAFKKNERAWRAFEALSPRHRLEYVMWIHTAKRPETRVKRIRESVALLAGGKRLGLK